MNFSVVCGEFIRLFVVNLFGRLWWIYSVVCEDFECQRDWHLTSRSMMVRWIKNRFGSLLIKVGGE